MRWQTSVQAAALLAALFVGCAAQGQGCDRGYRETTPAERRTMSTVLETAKAALPAAPAGWIIGGYEELSVLESLCMDLESQPFVYRFSRTFNRTDDAGGREATLAEARTTARAAQTERQPRIDALTARIQALGAELGPAAQRGDQTRIDAIDREIEQAQQEFEAIFAEGDDQGLAEQVATATAKDRVMSIAVSVNPGSVSDLDKQRAAAPAGAHSAYRWTQSADGVDTAYLLVLFGAWQPRSGGGVESLRRGAAANAAAHAIAVQVEADPARLDSLLASIDFDAIAALTR